MKKGNGNRLLKWMTALLITVCMIVSLIMPAFVGAEPMEDGSADTTSAESTESEEAMQVSADPSAPDEDPDTAEETVTESTEETENTEEEEKEEKDGSDVVNFVVIDQPNVQLPGTQKIAVSAGDDETAVSEAVLYYGMAGSDEELEVAASATDGNTALFEISYGEDAGSGLYELRRFSCRSGGEEFVSDFTAQGLLYQYGVDDDSASTDADAYIVEEDESEDDISLASGDADVSAQVAEGSEGIVSALEAAGAETESDELSLASGSNLVICLDPGHDSVHKGAARNGMNEEVLTLKIAQYLRQELAKYPNVTVYMTRESAACPVPNSYSECLRYRPQYAANVGADVFISLHINDANGTAAHGALVCVPNMNYRKDQATISQNLASKILEKLVALGMYNRGFDIRYGDDTYPDGSTTDYLNVIRNSKLLGIPGILIEHGFIGGTEDQKYLNNEAGLQSMAKADADGIAEYFGLNDLNFYAPVFDADYYWDNNKALQSVYNKGDTAALLNHFVRWGMAAGWQASREFNVNYYKNKYTQLQEVYGDNLNGYYMHYIRWGKAAGWVGSEEAGSDDSSGSGDSGSGSGGDTEKHVTTYDGVDYSAVYDPAYYWDNHKDIQSVYKKTDENSLIAHFVRWGMAASWQANEEFNVDIYKKNYPALVKTYGTNMAGYYLHYIRWGKAAGWNAKTENESSGGQGDSGSGSGADTTKHLTTYNGTDYAAVYDPVYYWDNHKDIQSVYKKTDENALIAHFVRWGMAASWQANEEFNVDIYKKNYPSLVKTYGTNMAGYYLHYIRWGKAAGWNAKTENESSGGSGSGSGADTTKHLTTYNGTDYAAVYDPVYYWDNHKDIQSVYKKTDENALIAHFVRWGMAASWQANEEFNVDIYKKNYPSLVKTYGTNMAGYYLHYIRWGKAAGWNAKTENESSGGSGSGSGADTTKHLTTYNGTDYAAVYDPVYYWDNHKDIQSVYKKTDENALIAHFVRWGMAASWQANEEFNVDIYKKNYPSLVKTYGTNVPGYYLHYIRWGKAAGWNAKTENEGAEDPSESGAGTKTHITTLDGVDYSAVYDPEYYWNNHTDLHSVYDSTNEEMLIAHFVRWGMAAGWQANEEFSVDLYRSNYPDLAQVYGSNLPGYYMHYIRWGKAAGLIANKAVDNAGTLQVANAADINTSANYTIMGNSTVSVNQMVAYYNKNAVYPSFYSTSDAPTINDFCRIIYEEAQAEGVKAEVVMAQAMDETGFLRYGGDVLINQYNFAGLGATGNGVRGNSFPDVRTGIRAQVQHLKAYASKEPLNYACVDVRFNLVTRGSAATVSALSMRWAMTTTYGEDLMRIIRGIKAS